MPALRQSTMALALLLAACDAPPDAAAPTAAPHSATPPVAAEANVVRLRVDGVEWSADRDIFCAVNPPGLARGVIIAGSRGPKDANEQTFNLNLSGVDGPGTLRLENSASVTHAIQLANLDAARFLERRRDGLRRDGGPDRRVGEPNAGRGPVLRDARQQRGHAASHRRRLCALQRMTAPGPRTGPEGLAP